MKILNETPNILKISYRQEKGDNDYGSCLWATFLFDLDDYTLHIESDCGNYAYGWSVTSSESFIHLMCRINNSYLINKISYETKFNLEKSITNTCKNIKYYESFDGEYSELIEEIKDIDDIYSDEVFYRLCDDIMGRYDLCDTFEIIECVKEYPIQAMRITEIFRDYIQPYLKEMENEMTKELKSCPFCGGKAYIESCDRLINIGCLACDFHLYFQGLLTTSPYGNPVSHPNSCVLEYYNPKAEEKAIEKWNTRKGENNG